MGSAFIQPDKGFLQANGCHGVIAGSGHISHTVVVSLQLIITAVFRMDKSGSHLSSTNYKVSIFIALCCYACGYERPLKQHASLHGLGSMLSSSMDYFVAQNSGKFSLAL